MVEYKSLNEHWKIRNQSVNFIDKYFVRFEKVLEDISARVNKY